MSALWAMPAQSPGDEKAWVAAKGMLEEMVQEIDHWMSEKETFAGHSSNVRSRSSSLEYI